MHPSCRLDSTCQLLTQCCSCSVSHLLAYTPCPAHVAAFTRGHGLRAAHAESDTPDKNLRLKEATSLPEKGSSSSLLTDHRDVALTIRWPQVARYFFFN